MVPVGATPSRSAVRPARQARSPAKTVQTLRVFETLRVCTSWRPSRLCGESFPFAQGRAGNSGHVPRFCYDSPC